MGIVETTMETIIAYWGYIGIMEKNMETTTVFMWVNAGTIGYFVVLQGIM